MKQKKDKKKIKKKLYKYKKKNSLKGLNQLKK